MLQAQAILLLVCAQSPEVYVVKGGMPFVSALQSVEYRTAFFHCRLISIPLSTNQHSSFSGGCTIYSSSKALLLNKR